MPVARYFLYVGGALLGLLFFLDAFLPDSPEAKRPDGVRPAIRIQSMEKLPDLVVFDTAQAITVDEHIAGDDPPTTPVEAVQARAENRKVFAQIVQQVVERGKAAPPRQREVKPQRKYAHARRHAPSRYAYFIDRRPRYAWFDRLDW